MLPACSGAVCLQAARQRETAALLASQDLLAEEERERARAAAKKAKKEKAKAKKHQAQEVLPSQPDEEPSMSPDAFASNTLAEASSEPTMPPASPALNADANDMGQPAIQADATSSAASGVAGWDVSDSDQAQWHSIGRKGADLPGSVVMAPAKVVEPVQVEPVQIEPVQVEPVQGEPALLSESSSCSDASFPWSCTPEHRLLHLLMCPITQVLLFTCAWFLCLMSPVTTLS